MADNERPQAKLTTFVTGFPDMEEDGVIESERSGTVIGDIPIHRTKWDNRLEKNVREWSSISTQNQTDNMSPGDEDFVVASQSRPSTSDQHDHISEHKRSMGDELEAAPPPEFEQRSPQLPSKINAPTSQKLVAASLDGYAIPGLDSLLDHDPDGFYREYRGEQTASRTALDNAKSLTTLNGSRQPSVKDLLKRFDQNNESSVPKTRNSSRRIHWRDLSALASLPKPSSPPWEEVEDVNQHTEARNEPGVHSIAQAPELFPGAGTSKSPGHGVAPVKGILRTPKEKSPEDLSSIRSGVVPLKNAKKNGNSADMRWTKISRKLVNPQALESGKERFEAREDFVIVLRVLTREEVQAYADLTSSIRAKREQVQGNAKTIDPVQKTPEEAEGKEERRLEHIKNLQPSDPDQNIEDAEDLTQVQDISVEETVMDQVFVPTSTFEDSDDGLPIDGLSLLSRGKRENSEEQDDSRSDRSGASSLASVTASIFSIVSGSSMSSIAGPQNAVERLVSLLLDDEVIKSLCNDALSDIERERFERNLRRLLKEFAVELRKEAESEPERHAAHFVRLRARNSAYIICSTLSKKRAKTLENMEGEILSEESGSDQSDNEVDDLIQLENFIRCSKAIGLLRENLRAFVHPANISSKSKLEDGAPSTVTESSMDESLGTLYHGQANNLVGKAQEMGDDYSLERKQPTLIGYREEVHIEKSAASRASPSEVEYNTKVPVRYADNAEDDNSDGGYGYTNTPELLRYDLDGTRSDNTDDLRLTIFSQPHLDSRARSSSPQVQSPSTQSAGIRTQADARLHRQRLQQLRDRKTMPHSFSQNNPKDIKYDSNADDIKHSTMQARHKLDRFGNMAQNAEVTEMELSQTERSMESATASTLTSIYHKKFTIGIMDSLKWTANTVPKGMTRIKLKCKCGHTITDDYDTQLSDSQALERIRQKLDHSNSISTRSSRMNSLSQVFSSGLQNIRSAISTSKTEVNPSLPTFEMQVSPIPTQTQPLSPTPPHVDPMYLLVCYNEGRHVTKLFQLDLRNILQAETDKALFQTLHQSYRTLRSRWFSWMSLRVLESINFVHFEMYKSELVDIRKQNDLPLPSDTSYRYNPAPPELVPPIGSHYLVHVLQHPECAEDEPICLSRFPKKLKERLACIGATGMKPGWGLQITESWDAKKIWLIGFVFFGLGSLAIGILWAVLKHSVQDAFAIAAYVVAFATISIGTVQALLEM